MSMQEEQLTDARHQDVVEDEDTPSTPFDTTDPLTTLSDILIKHVQQQ